MVDNKEVEDDDGVGDDKVKVSSSKSSRITKKSLSIESNPNSWISKK